MGPTSIFAMLMALIRFKGSAIDAVARARLLPTSNDKAIINTLLDQLQQRRVFHAPFHDEVVNACVASVDEVRRLAYDVHSRLENEPAKAFVGALLDDARGFVDRWKASSIYPTVPGWDRCFGPAVDDGDLREFYQSLGGLREKVGLYVDGLTSLRDGGLFESSQDED